MIILAFCGALGLLGMGPLFPWLALFLRSGTASAGAIASLDVLIPAHDEAATIGATLASLRAAGAQRIIVGADACSDDTAARARTAGAEVREFSFRSKWRVLRALVDASNAEWVAFVDAGALWPADLLTRAAEKAGAGVAALAPSYRPARASRAERLHWAVEAWLKRQENKSSGPVSVHGATVLYRREALRSAFTLLEGGEWLNDDVVIPSAIHITAPELRVEYLDACVSDLGLGAEGRRRDRLVRGNLQWVRFLLPQLRRNPAAFTVALRRVFRLFWAYWFLFFSAGLTGLGCWPALATLLPLLAFPRAAWSSFTAPFLVFSQTEAAWR
jgi:glycosyltransferase involved in cell wall biosynthesis